MRESFAQFAGHRWWKQVLLTGAVLLILLARVPDFWRSGEFVAEDGWVFFADQFNHPGPGTLVLPYAGYFHLVPRVVAALWSILPIPWQPYAFAFTGLAINAGILGAFYLPAFRRVVAADAGRLAVVLFLAIAPNAENLGVVLGLHWYLVFGLVLVLIASPPIRAGSRLAVLALIVLCIWSSPAALVLLPFFLLRWRNSQSGTERLQAVVTAGLIILVGILVACMRWENPVRTAPFQWRDAALALDHLVLRGWIGVSLLGPRLAGYLAREFPLALDLGALVVLGALAAVLWRNRTRDVMRAAAVILGAALLMLLISLTRTLYLPDLAHLPLPTHVRYITAPTLLLYVGLAIILSGASPPFLRRFLPHLVVLPAVLLVVSWRGQVHWAHRPVWFHLRDAVPAIAQMKAKYARDGRPASLYVPSDVPYAAPVLEVGGGVIIPPAVGLKAAIGASVDQNGRCQSWLGEFTPAGPDGWIEHARWGRIQFTGVERGRVFFRDAAGRFLFTSTLLYPRLWVLDRNEWTLVQPAQNGSGTRP
jgi:hypothetical protein